MIGLLQRVSEARVSVEGNTVGAIGRGLVVLLGVARGDREREAERLLERILGYRVFPDEAGRMNRSLLEAGGALLVVSQFTLLAETDQGTRPGFSRAAVPEDGERLYTHFLDRARLRLGTVASGRFGAHMLLSLTNDGPVTFWLEVTPNSGA